ncbi:MAG: hypothetical protein RBT62_08300, partial [Spirochaetia bacterium]|nr:hypothetical protein [Spirochaetia bacterium]
MTNPYATVLFLVFSVQVGSYAIGWGSEETPFPGFDGTMYEQTFSRADRARDPERWMLDANDGVQAAIANWERSAALYYSGTASIEGARSTLLAWTEEDMARRFSVWLRDLFFGREGISLSAMVADASAQANRRLLYQTNADGERIYDETGNPVYRTRVEGVSIAGDTASWSLEVSGATSRAVSILGARLEAIRNRLVSLVPLRQRDSFLDLIARSESEATNTITLELDALAKREERLFVARRSSDIFSLRQRSEKETASVMAAEIVRSTSLACEQSLEALNVRIEAARRDNSELNIAGADWLSDFKIQFDRGLSSWKAAEERFMVRRLEWERDAARAFYEGNEAWALAYAGLEKEQRAWESKASLLLQKGEDTFAKASLDLEDDIRQAKIEFQRDALQRTSASADRASAWVDVYLQASAAATGFKEAASYWLALLGPESPLPDSETLESWLAERENAPGTDDKQAGYIAQVRDCMASYASYVTNAMDARENVLHDFDLVMGFEAGALQDVLAGDASSEDFNLDEFQVALLRAKAIEGYWTRRVSIAKAVLDYANDLSSGRVTEAEHIQRLRDAQEAYDEGLETYGQARASLSESATDIAEGRLSMNTAVANLETAGEALESVNAEYSMLLAALASGGDGGFIGQDIFERYRDLLRIDGITSADAIVNEQAGSVAFLLARYIESARALGHAQDIERAGEALRLAVNGSAMEPSLKALAATHGAINVPSDIWAVPLDIDAYGIQNGDPSYSLLEGLMAEMTGCLAAAVTHDDVATIRKAYGGIIIRVAEGARTRAATALTTRLAGIALLGSRSAKEWYEGQRGEELQTEGCMDALLHDAMMAGRNLLLARVELELQAIGILLGTIAPEEAPGAGLDLALNPFSSVAKMDAESAVEARGSLEALHELILATMDADEPAFNSSLEALARDDEAIAMFARGRGFFTLAGADLGSLFLPVESSEIDGTIGLLHAYDRYGPSAIGLEEQRLNACYTSLLSSFASLGLGIEDGNCLPSTRELGQRLLEPGVDAVHAMIEITRAVEQSRTSSPPWVSAELYAWRDSIVDYVARRTIVYGSLSPEPSFALQQVLDANDTQCATLARILHGLSGTGDTMIQALCQAGSELAWSSSESSTLRHETARLMSQALIVDAAWLNETPDWQALENSITASAESRFSYADDVLRNMAVSLAMDTLRIDDALGMERDPSLLSGAALKTRLESIWMNIEPQSIAEAASVAVNTIARTAYAMRSLVFDALSMDGLDVDRDDIASLLEPGHDGEVSWLDTYYQSEGEEAGSVMAFLLVQALGSESDPWSLEIAKNRVDSLALDSIDGALSCRDRLRDGTGLASIPAERLLAMRIAMLSPDNDYLAWVLEAMGLRGREGVQSLVSEPSNDPVAEAFLDLGDYQYAFEAASFFLASQALDGILPASVYENRYPLGSSLRAERLQHILEQTGDFAGTYSGDTLGWAMRRSAGDDDLALALVRYLEFGTLDDDIADLCGFGLHGSRPGDAFVRWVVGNVSMLAESKVQDSKGISVAIEFSRAYETALAKSSEGAAHGALHWRQYLLSDAIAIANSEAGASSCLPLPGTPGDPETEPCGVPCSARSWSEGALIDSFEEAHRCCSVFNQTMEAWKASIADRNDRGDGARLASAAYRAFETFSALVSQYGSSPETAFDPDSVTLVPVGLCLEHQKADGDYRASGYSRIAAHDAIARLAKAYSLVSDVGAIEQRLLSIQEEIVLARDANTDAMRLFAEASEAFSLAGASYETAHVLYMELYENLEATRLFLEKERAIERWASSAYLYAGEETDSADLACSYKSPQEESSCAEECLSRAQKSLEMLKRLYGDDVSGRPYDSPEHDAARELYRLNLERVMLSAKARDALSTALSSEYRCNEAAYTEYRKSVFGDSCGAYKMVARPLDFSEYTIPVSNEDASWKDFLRLGSDGRLALALDGGYRLIAVDGAVAKRLEEYFNTPSKPVDAVDEHESTAYERDVRTWSSRVQTYMAKASSFNDWAMARDYLVGRIISANPEFTVLQGSITHASHLSNTVGSQHIQGSCLADQIETYSKDAMLVSQLNAFNRMSAQERADLEFYVILSLTGGARLSSSAFGKASELAEYEFVYKAINTEIATKQSNAKNLNIAGATFWGLGMLFSWTPIGPVYLCSAGVMFGMAIIENTCAQTLTRLNASYVVPELMVTRATLSSGRSMLSSELAGINHSYAEYKQSCGRLAVLKGTNPGVDPSVAMKSALQQLECLDADEVMALLDMFDVCKADGAGVYTSTAEALTSLSRWSAANRDSAFQNTERVYARDEATRLENERRYREENERFISFGTGEASVAQAAFAAYGPQAASCKKHLYDVVDSTRKLVLSEEPGMVSKESTDAARLYVRLIDRAVNARYAAE